MGLVAGLAVLGAVAACSGAGAPAPASTTIGLSAPASSATSPTDPPADPSAVPSTVSSTVPSPAGTVQVSTVATGLASPWGLDFLPDGRAVVTSRDTATISLVDPDGTITPVGTVDGVVPGGEGGLLGIAVSPAFSTDHRLYVYYTAAQDNRIATVELVDGAIGNQQVGFTGIPKAGIHNGGRIVFGPDGLLYVGTGDAGDRPQAQDPDALGGKILRLDSQLRPAAGNPDDPVLAGGAGYSLGHRNVQGLAFDDRGRLWAAEFGQNTWDELNLVQAGDNDGWPVVEGIGDNPDGVNPEFVNPQRQWSTADASPSGIAFWQGSIWMAGLRGQQLWQIPLTESGAESTGESNGELTGEPVGHLNGVYGRLRTVVAAPDGSLWLITSNTDGRGDVRDGDDRILRLQPAA